MELKGRVLKTVVDEHARNMVITMRLAAASVKTQKDWLIAYIQEYQALYKTVFTEEERTELETLNITINQIVTYIENNLPDLPRTTLG